MIERNTFRLRFNDLLSYAALFIAFYFATNGELRYTDSTFLYYFPGALCLVALGMELLVRPVWITSYLVWRILLLLLLAITMIYGLDSEAAFGVAKQCILQTLVVILIAVKCAYDQRNIQRIMMIAVVACAVTSIYLISSVDMSQIAAGERLGSYSVNDKWNANNIGMLGVYGILLTFASVFVFSSKITVRRIVFSGALIVLMGYVVILSGSRKAVMCILATLLLYIMRMQKSKKVRNTLLAAVVLLFALYAIYNVPILYEHLGSRFDSMFATLQGGNTENSARIRQEMIEMGLEAFAQRPLFGYGMDGFSILWKQQHGTLMYSHNNYVELLVTGGLVLCVLYYGYIVKVLFRKSVDNKQSAFIKGLLVAILAADMGVVSYYDPLVQYVLCLAVYCIFYDRQLDEICNGRKRLEK